MKVKDIFVDFETYCEQPIKEVGAWRYGMDKTCEVLCMAYSIDGKPTKIWHPLMDHDPDDLLDAVEAGARFHAWNATFEYVVWNYVQAARHGWPKLKRGQVRCTMALAAYHSLPLSLEKAGAAVGASVQKDKEGARLLKKFSSPRKPTKNNPSTRIRPEDDPEDFQKLCDYCVTDVDTELAIMDELPLQFLPGIEQSVFELDLKINERGVKVDVDAAEAIIEAAAVIGEELESEAAEIMGGETKTSQRAAVMEWAAGQGFELENYQAGYIRELIKRDDLPPKVHRVLEIREALAKTSVTKYGKMVACASFDDHVRGSIQYYGAQRTGRFAGRLLQVHNLPRGTVKGVDSVAMYAAYLKAQDWMLLFDKPMEAFSSLIRSMIVAPEGKIFFAADFSNIEGRGVAWLAGQKDMIAQFAAGDDLYKHMAATIFGTTYHKVDDDQRWVGKQAVLGCFAPETLVVTNRGAVPIIYVRPDDLLWDGVEWVSHDGVIDQGIKPVIEVEGIRVTPDHGVYVDEGVMVPAAEVDWARAHAFGGLPVVENPSENCLFYRELFSYNPATGELRHRERDRKWFVADWSWKKWNREYVGQIAGVSTNTSGHKGTSLVFGRQETQHRIIWEMVYGQPAENDIDHVNGVKTDNRLINLRAATRAQNVANSGRYSSNTTGFDGVAVHTCRDGTIRWTAACGGYVGLYDSPEEAANARDRAAVTKYGPFARLNFKENEDRHVYDILNAGPRHRFAIITAQGVDIVTNCGYGMGAQKFLDTCTGYGRDVGLALAKKAVKAYRDKNQKIVKLWYATERAAKDAVRQPGTKFKAERLTYLVKDGFLWCKLPSGRTLAYHSPRLEDDRLTYMGVSQTTNQWSRQDTYGGKLVENAVQAIARDVLVEAMLRAEAAGYPIIMTVHDEVVSATEPRGRSVEDFVSVLCEVPDWAEGFPVAAAGWSGDRYRKD